MTNFEKIDDRMLAHKFKTVIIDVEYDCEFFFNKRFQKWIKFIRAETEELQEEAVKNDAILEKAKKESDRFMGYEYVQDLAFQEKMLKWEAEERERLREEEFSKRMEKSNKEAKKIGLERGLERGNREGEFNEKCKMARVMYANNETLEKIMLYTNLTEEKLKDIISI